MYFKMPGQGVFPPAEVSPARQALGSLARVLNVALAFPFASKVFVACAAAPLILTQDAVERGSGLATAQSGGVRWLWRYMVVLWGGWRVG
jgi:hypothetical protein